MDPFTHILLGYLVTFGAFGPNGIQYVVAGAVAGGLPDADVVFFPLSKRFPLLRHRGISHSIVGVSIIALAGAFLVPLVFADYFGPSFAAGSTVLYFLAMEAGGLSHVFLDALDHWSVPVFAPFSDHEYHFDADRIFNFGAMVFTVVSYTLMLYERGRFPVWAWEATVYVLLALAVTYFAVRLTGRWSAGRAARRLGFTAVIPQANPLLFLLVAETVRGNDRTIRFAPYDLVTGLRSEPRTIVVPKTGTRSGAVPNAAEALARSYAPALERSWVLGETHHFGEVTEAPGCYEVFWYSLELTFFGRAAGVIATVDPETGRVETRSKWKSPIELGRPPDRSPSSTL